IVNKCNLDSLAGRRVRILYFSRQVVSSGILMCDDNDNVVMGKKLGGEYYEVSILIAHDPTVSLFIKDADRKNMNDDVGNHRIWFKEYFVCCNLSWSKEKASSFEQITNLLPPHVNNFIY
ncbi:hypothetical protein Taro_035208, partial [Colocasia esculenta]|nr:hypothetical protein [Colocasia esculenta]